MFCLSHKIVYSLPSSVFVKFWHEPNEVKDTCAQSENYVGAERKDFQDPKLNSHLGFENRKLRFPKYFQFFRVFEN